MQREITCHARNVPPESPKAKVHKSAFLLVSNSLRPSLKFVLGILAEADGGLGGCFGKYTQKATRRVTAMPVSIHK